MKQTTTIIWKAEKKVNQKGNIGYLLLSTRVGGKQKLRSLGLPPINKNHWLKKSNRVSDSFPETMGHNAESINKYLETKLIEASLAHHDFRYMPNDKKSFLEYWQQQIDLCLNQGTILKYQNVKILLEKYINEEFNSVDLKFKDITPPFIIGFKNWLRINNKNTLNTANNKLKNVQAFINRAIIEGVYHYPKNPFDNIDYKFETTKVKPLQLEELEKIINTQYVEVVRSTKRFGLPLTDRALNDPRYTHQFSLNDYRNFWLFQLFAQGLRVSDLLTLRWNDFQSDDELRIIKKMIKTKSDVTIYINDKLIDILTPYVFKAINEKNIIISERIKVLLERANETKEKELNRSERFLNSDGKTKQELSELSERSDFFRRKAVKDAIGELCNDKKTRTSFVFGILSDDDFKDVGDNNDFGVINKKQYNRISSQRSYYNRMLKLVQAQAEVKKTLTTHLARHSYTSLMVEMGEEINLFDIMTSLGHKHLATTQTYLSKFTNKKLDKLNKVLSEKLNANWKLTDGGVYNPINKLIEGH
jgi:integrase/recombinase XerD